MTHKMRLYGQGKPQRSAVSALCHIKLKRASSKYASEQLKEDSIRVFRSIDTPIPAVLPHSPLRQFTHTLQWPLSPASSL